MVIHRVNVVHRPVSTAGGSMRLFRELEPRYPSNDLQRRAPSRSHWWAEKKWRQGLVMVSASAMSVRFLQHSRRGRRFAVMKLDWRHADE